MRRTTARIGISALLTLFMLGTVPIAQSDPGNAIDDQEELSVSSTTEVTGTMKQFATIEAALPQTATITISSTITSLAAYSEFAQGITPTLAFSEPATFDGITATHTTAKPAPMSGGEAKASSITMAASIAIT